MDNAPVPAPSGGRDVVSQSHARAEKIHYWCRALRTSWIGLAEELYHFDDLAGWRHLGYASLREFLLEPEVGLSTSHAYHLISVYRTFVVEREIARHRVAEADVTKLVVVAPSVRRGETQATDALADAIALTRPDLETKYRQSSKAIDPANEPVWMTCPHCGSRYPTKGE